jgi:hypothetical protein
MHSGITSPARPWFKLTVPDADLAERDDVKQYLHDVETRMQKAMVKSNYYKTLSTLYQDLGVFGTGAFLILEDDQTVFRCYDYSLGTFAVANDERREVRIFVRVCAMTAFQIVKRWGNLDALGRPDFLRDEPSTISVTVQNLWRRSPHTYVDVIHVIQPNASYDGEKIAAKYKRYEEIYYEVGSSGRELNDSGFLGHSGYSEWPVMVGRWEKGDEDVYGTSCPGMTALGDVKQLQLMERRKAQAVDKKVNPPLVGPSRLVNSKVSALPGDVNYDDTPSERSGLRPLYQVTFDTSELREDQQDVRNRVRSAFHVNTFLMLSQSEHAKTATEVDELKEEKLLVIGPTLEQINDDVLDQSIERIFGIMQRKGLFPPPPPDLQGENLHIEYVSIAAQALRMVGIQSIERTAAFAGQVMQVKEEAGDVIDFDQLIREHGDATGVPPKVLRSDDDVAAIRQQRAQAMAQQQAAQNVPAMAGAARDLSETSTQNDSVLAKLVNGQAARATLNATARPAA